MTLSIRMILIFEARCLILMLHVNITYSVPSEKQPFNLIISSQKNACFFVCNKNSLTGIGNTRVLPSLHVFWRYCNKKKKVIKSWYNTDICQNVPFVQIYTSCWGPCWLRDLGECEQSGFDPSWGFGVSVHNIFPRRHLTTEP